LQHVVNYLALLLLRNMLILEIDKKMKIIFVIQIHVVRKEMGATYAYDD